MGQGFRKGEEMKNWILCIIALAFIVTGSVGSAAENSSDAQYLIYLHGWIIQEQQDPRPQHPQFGYYEYEEILKTFRDQGFIVSSEIRPKTATIESAADLLVLQIQELLKSGVPANRVTVVGGSMGAGIALVASARLENANVVDPEEQTRHDRVFFGATVTYVTADGSEVENTVTIVGVDESEHQPGRVTLVSPIARALLRAEVGDEVYIQTPAGNTLIEVTEIRYG